MIEIGGAVLVADRSGAIYWPDEATLIVADLHLEKGSAFAVRGSMLPPYDTRSTLAKLAEVIERRGPHRVVALGDSLHDRAAGERLGSEERAMLAAMQAGREWLWVTGNHDPEIPAYLGGEVVASVDAGALRLQHEPGAQPEGAAPRIGICGHLHPAARVALRGTSHRGPCFIGSETLLVMPAFGAFTGGLNVLDEAFRAVFGDASFSVQVLGRDGVYPVAVTALRPD